MPGSPAPLLRLWNTHWQFLKELSTSPSICPCTGPYQPRREAASRFRGLPEPNQIRLPGSDSQQIVLFAHKCSNLIFSSQPWHYSRAVALEPVGKQSLTLGRTEGLEWAQSGQLCPAGCPLSGFSSKGYSLPLSSLFHQVLPCYLESDSSSFSLVVE